MIDARAADPSPSPRRRGCGRRCGRRRRAGAARAGRGSAGRRAAPGCRRPAARRRCRRRPLLADDAVAHDDDVVGDLADHAEVVADEEHAHPVPLLEAGEQLEDLALDRDVERGRRLVGDQQLGLAGERHRDHDALLLAAGELVRVRRQAPLRLGHADLGEQRFGARDRLAPAHAEVLDQRLGDLLADREHRVERAHRVLEHAGDVAAAQRLQLARATRRAGRGPGT